MKRHESEIDISVGGIASRIGEAAWTFTPGSIRIPALEVKNNTGEQKRCAASIYSGAFGGWWFEVPWRWFDLYPYETKYLPGRDGPIMILTLGTYDVKVKVVKQTPEVFELPILETSIGKITIAGAPVVQEVCVERIDPCWGWDACLADRVITISAIGISFDVLEVVGSSTLTVTTGNVELIRVSGLCAGKHYDVPKKSITPIRTRCPFVYPWKPVDGGQTSSARIANIVLCVDKIV